MAISVPFHWLRALGGWNDLDPERAALMRKLPGVSLDVVDGLFAHGVRASTLPVLEWLPAVDVCWFDGADPAEVDALRTQYLKEPWATPEGAALLDAWLAERPSWPLLAAGWIAVCAMLSSRDETARAALIARVLEHCEVAGRAAGGGPGEDPLSSAERRQIERYRRGLVPSSLRPQ